MQDLLRPLQLALRLGLQHPTLERLEAYSPDFPQQLTAVQLRQLHTDQIDIPCRSC